MGKYRKFLIMALAAGLVTALMASGVLDYADLAVSDRFYQSRSASDGEIVLVGIDQKALEDIGPYSQWGREVMAAALAALNESEACRPAVIAMDVLYSGETDGAGDARLAEEAGRYGNVVAACAAVFGSSLAEAETGEYYLDNFSVIAFDAPYEALGEAAEQGHINAMLDRDGILRHHLLEIGLEDGRRVPSLALKTAEMYREYHGMEQGALPPADARGFWYLPFCGVPGDMEAISLSDVLSGKVPADYFAGKIVLIGPYAAGLQDSYLTAADHAAPMYGMEFQANAIQALLWEDYRREVPDGIQLTALFFLLLLALAGFWKRKVRLSTGLWLLLCAGAVGFCRLMYDRGLVLHLLWIPLGVTALYVGCIAFNYMQASLEKRRITNTFERYVAPEIVREILREGTGGLELGGKLTRIAVLFVDVRGFTPMSERLKPTQVVEILNCYLSLISDCILKNGGTLDKFVGDAAMAFWGAPLPQEDYVMHALKAAADMAEGSRALSQELLKRYGRTVSFGIGVHVGEAVVGNIGSAKRMDYTAIGDTVNTAARLEANAPAGTIYISRAVADEAGERIRTTSLGDTVKLKGKKEGFEVLCLEEIL
ncbi:adenylate/guanylate cyclase domain-containing protein [uncultured Acetatifactor sp.]|uniref:CHASE2 domain-containing protein n=1 Tax=uncultured Acetatifactor sp. TaxID=1671927 RepID=UPI002614B2B0|nr:adenylate/guanylate cyclase domain-containing protein [uncultured Acetatifactor sp.]